MNNRNFPEHILKLQEQGKKCLDALLGILEGWPVGEYSLRIDFGLRTTEVREFICKAIEEFEEWVNALALQRTIHDQRKLRDLVETLNFAVLKEDFRDNAISDGRRVREEFLSLVTSIPISGWD